MSRFGKVVVSQLVVLGGLGALLLVNGALFHLFVVSERLQEEAEDEAGQVQAGLDGSQGEVFREVVVVAGVVDVRVLEGRLGQQHCEVVQERRQGHHERDAAQSRFQGQEQDQVEEDDCSLDYRHEFVREEERQVEVFVDVAVVLD